MTINEYPEEKFLGFPINQTSNTILAFLSLTICIKFIPTFFIYGQQLYYLIIHYSFPELLTHIVNVIQSIIAFLIPLSVLSFLITIFILCVIKRKSYNKEEINVRWLFFKQTKASVTVLFIVSLIYLPLNSFYLYNSINYTIYFILRGYIDLIALYAVSSITELISIIIHIYTLIICVKNRETFR
jgi:hypothetical protein